MTNAVRVLFKQEGGWSKPYTYKCGARTFKKDDVILVPNMGFVKAVRVSEFLPNYDFNENVEYKSVVGCCEVYPKETT